MINKWSRTEMIIKVISAMIFIFSLSHIFTALFVFTMSDYGSLDQNIGQLFLVGYTLTILTSILCFLALLKKIFIALLLFASLTLTAVILDTHEAKKQNKMLCEQLKLDPLCTKTPYGGYSCSDGRFLALDCE